MTGFTHKQAGRYMRADLDGLLTDTQRHNLQTHLDECETCRLEFESFSSLTARLQIGFRARWDTQHGPSTHVMANIQSQTRRITMRKRINFAFNLLGGTAALLVLFFVVTAEISQFVKKPPAANGSQVPVSTPQSNDRLLAFTSNQDGNAEIYTMHPDGTDITDLTNNPAQDANPFWSPNGKRIAFESDRDGYSQIFLMNANGSNLVQLTNEEIFHALGGQNNTNSNPWSPDGSKIVYSKSSPYENLWTIFIMDIDTGREMPIFNEPAVFWHLTWSPDGKHIAFVVFDSQNQTQKLYVTDKSGNNLLAITKSLPAEEHLDGYNPISYYWSRDGQSIFFIASNLPLEDSFGFGSDSPNPYYWKAYEASRDGRTLATHATTHSPIGGWWQGDYFVTPFIGIQGWTWIHSDGVTTVNPFKNCADPSGGGARYQQSSNGNVVIGAMCPNYDWWLYWVNPKGTMLPLIKAPIKTSQGDMQNLVWSRDDKFIAFDISATDNTEMYIINVTEALKDPLLPPLKISLGGSKVNSPPAWQPAP